MTELRTLLTNVGQNVILDGEVYGFGTIDYHL